MKKKYEISKNLFKKWLKNEWLGILVLSFGNIAAAGLTVCFSLISRTLVDSAVAAEHSAVAKNALLLAIVSAGSLALQALMSGISDTVKARLKNRHRQQLLSAILHKEFASASKYHSGELVNRIFSDVQVIAEGIVGIIPPLLGMVSRLCAATVVLWRFDPRFTLILLVLGSAMTFGGTVFKRKMKGLHKGVQREEDSVHAVFIEILENLRFVKASGSEKTMEARVEERQHGFFAAQMRRRNFSLFTHVSFGAVTELCWLITMVWGCFGIANGALSFGTLTAMMQLVGQIQSPLAGFPTLLQRFYSVSASAERLEELYSLPNESSDVNLPKKENPPVDFKKIQLENLQFVYDRNTVLSNVSGQISKGDFVAITGLSGGGKTTLFLLLLGIYKPADGKIEFITEGEAFLPSAATRALFSYVPQGNAIFSGSIRDNLMMLCENADEEMLWKAAKVACIDEFIDSLPQKMDTVLGERGLGLSEGQTQRLAVARAVAGRAPILLLDEATSALDEETEAAMLSNLSELNDTTCLIVTHRKAALSICNKQLQLENGYGRISEIVSQTDID